MASAVPLIFALCAGCAGNVAVRMPPPPAAEGTGKLSADREGMVAALDGLRDRRATAALCEALGHPSWDVRAPAARALGEIRDRRAVRSLVISTRRRGGAFDHGIRKEAAEALGRIGDPRATAALKDLVGDDGVTLRHTAVRALEQLTLDPEAGWHAAVYARMLGSLRFR